VHVTQAELKSADSVALLQDKLDQLPPSLCIAIEALLTARDVARGGKRACERSNVNCRGCLEGASRGPMSRKSSRVWPNAPAGT